MLARCKLNSIESKISEVFVNNEISYEDFMIIINEERIRMMNSQRSDGEKIIWLKKVKKLALIKLLNAMKLLITVKSHNL